MIAAAPVRERALWATAFYAGLRRGELMALRWQEIDLAAGLIRVERSWGVRAGLIEPKSRAGKRVAATLADTTVSVRNSEPSPSSGFLGRAMDS